MKKINLSFFKYLLFFIVIFAQSCGTPINLTKKKAENSNTNIIAIKESKVKISTISLSKGGLNFSGTNLEHVKSIKITDEQGNSFDLNKTLSLTGKTLKAASSTFQIIPNKIYKLLIIDDANAATEQSFKVEITKGSIKSEHLSDMDAKEGEILQWNGQKWVPVAASTFFISKNTDSESKIIQYEHGLKVLEHEDDKLQIISVDTGLEKNNILKLDEEANLVFSKNNRLEFKSEEHNKNYVFAQDQATFIFKEINNDKIIFEVDADGELSIGNDKKKICLSDGTNCLSGNSTTTPANPVIVDNSITAAKIATGAITQDKLETNVANSIGLVNATITSTSGNASFLGTANNALAIAGSPVSIPMLPSSNQILSFDATSGSWMPQSINNLGAATSLNPVLTGTITVGADSSDVFGYGDKLILLGKYNNSDPLWIARYNNNPGNGSHDHSEIRVNLGDDGGTNDAFSVGLDVGTNWLEDFRVEYGLTKIRGQARITPNRDVTIPSLHPSFLENAALVTGSGTLGANPGDTLNLASFGFYSAHNQALRIMAKRTGSAPNNNWEHSSVGLGIDVDATPFIAEINDTAIANAGGLWFNTDRSIDVVGDLKVSNNLIVTGGISYGPDGKNTQFKDDANDSTSGSGFFQTQNPVNYPAGASDWWHLLDIHHSVPGNNYAMQMAGSFHDQNFYVRKTQNNPAQSWLKLVTIDPAQPSLSLPGTTVVANTSSSVGMNATSSNAFGGTYDKDKQGGMITIDSTNTNELFQWYGRPSGSDTSTKIMTLDKTGNIATSGKIAGTNLRVGTSAITDWSPAWDTPYYPVQRGLEIGAYNGDSNGIRFFNYTPGGYHGTVGELLIAGDLNGFYGTKSLVFTTPSATDPIGQGGAPINTLGLRNGMVGVGTITPNEKLEVAGNISLNSTTENSKLIFKNYIDDASNNVNYDPMSIEKHTYSADLTDLRITIGDNDNLGQGWWDSMSIGVNNHDGTDWRPRFSFSSIGVFSLLGATPNSDPMSIQQYVHNSDLTELRITIGDNGINPGDPYDTANVQDSFTVGINNAFSTPVAGSWEEKFSVRSNGNIRSAGDITVGQEGSAWLNDYGKKLNFSGSSTNGDVLWMARYNSNWDTADLRINLGDDRQATDGFSIGTTWIVDNHWYEHFRVTAAGTVGIGTSTPAAQTKLHVKDGRIRVEDATGESGTMEFASGTKSSFIFVEGSNGDHPGAFHIRTDDADEHVLLQTDGTQGNVGIGIAEPSEKLHVAGNGLFTGTVTQSSDSRLKTNINPLVDALDKILQLQGVSYNWKDIAKDKENGKQVGLIAQDVEKVYPEMVKTDDKGIKSISYQNLVSPLIEAVKSIFNKLMELVTKVKENERRIKDLEKENGEIKLQLKKLEEKMNKHFKN